MSRNAAPARGAHQRQQIRFAAFVENRLRRLDHQFDSQRAGLEVEHRFQTRADVGERRDFIG